MSFSVNVERKCALTPPGADWKPSPLFAGDAVVVATTLEGGERAYLRIRADDGLLDYTTKRADATPVTLGSATYERDALREQNEITLASPQHGAVYMLRDGTNGLRAFVQPPPRTVAAPVRFVPTLLTDERQVRGLTKATPTSPFDSSAGPTGEGALVRYGDRVLLRVPSLETTPYYEYVSCTDASCAVPPGLSQRVPDPDAVAAATTALAAALRKRPVDQNDVLAARLALQRANDGKTVRAENAAAARSFSFQCPSGGLMYYRPVKRQPRQQVLPEPPQPPQQAPPQPPQPPQSPQQTPPQPQTSETDEQAPSTVLRDEPIFVADAQPVAGVAATPAAVPWYKTPEFVIVASVLGGLALLLIIVLVAVALSKTGAGRTTAASPFAGSSSAYDYGE